MPVPTRRRNKDGTFAPVTPAPEAPDYVKNNPHINRFHNWNDGFMEEHALVSASNALPMVVVPQVAKVRRYRSRSPHPSPVGRERHRHAPSFVDEVVKKIQENNYAMLRTSPVIKILRIFLTGVVLAWFMLFTLERVVGVNLTWLRPYQLVVYVGTILLPEFLMGSHTPTLSIVSKKRRGEWGCGHCLGVCFSVIMFVMGAITIYRDLKPIMEDLKPMIETAIRQELVVNTVATPGSQARKEYNWFA